jgi:rSAM/selenodomain-associated transferase 2
MSASRIDEGSSGYDRAVISIVIPVFHDSEALERTFAETDVAGCEVIVAATVDDRASLSAIRSRRPDITWIESARGRARQMNAGASAARGDWIVFLHADTRLARGWRDEVATAANDPRVVAGCFRFTLDARRPVARLIEGGVRVRVRLFGLPYGDQALFVRREVFEAMGGFADLPLMEDVEFVRRLRQRGRLFRSPVAALTSARRWERDGWIRRSITNVLLLTGYFCGVTPERLWHLYNTNHADHTRPGHPQL